MRNMLKSLPTASLAFLAFAMPDAARAAGFYLQEQSTKAVGRAFSGEVADQGAESLWWNPAAIGGLKGGAAYFGVSGILPSGEVENVNTIVVRPGPSPGAVGGDQRAENPIEAGLLPAGAIAFAVTPKLAFGVALTSPFSFSTDYDATSWTRYTADRTSLKTLDIQPTIAYMVTPELSLGAGLNIEYSDAILSNYLPNVSAALPDGHQELKGDGWDLGYSVGAQYRRGPLSLGASYKSSVEHELEGSVTTSGLLGPLAANNGKILATATFKTPWQAIVGARVAVSPKLTLNAQATRFGWSEFKTIDLGPPLNTSIPENYKDTWNYGIGLDYAASPAWTLRAGVQYDETPTRDGERDARVPDASRVNFAVGASHTMSKSFIVDAAAMYTSFDDAAIDRTTAAYAGTAVQTPILVDGRLRDASAVILALGGRLKF